MKNQDGGLNVPLFVLKPSECHERCQNLIGSYRHQFIVSSTLLAPATEIRKHKATEIHTLKPLTYELFFQKSSKMKSKL